MLQDVAELRENNVSSRSCVTINFVLDEHLLMLIIHEKVFN